MYTKQQVIDLIRNGLEKQAFFDWYTEGGAFDSYLLADDDAPDMDDIEQDIVDIFNIK